MKMINSVSMAFFVGFVVGIALTMVFFYFVFPIPVPPARLPLRPQDAVQRVTTNLIPPDLLQGYSIYNSSWTLQSLDGSLVQSDAFKGKVVFVNIWAPWNQGCVSELPFIDSLIRTSPSSDIAFLLLTDEKQDTVRSFLQQHGFSLPVYFYSQGYLPSSLATDYYPTTFIINRKGQVVLRHPGQANWNHPSVHEFLSMQLD